MRLLLSFLSVFIVFGLIFFSGCSGEGPNGSNSSSVPMAPGEKTFRSNCSSCHAMGFGFRSIDGLAKKSSALQDESTFLQFIREPQSVGQYNMPGFRASELSDDDAQALFLWLQKKYRKQEASLKTDEAVTPHD